MNSMWNGRIRRAPMISRGLSIVAMMGMGAAAFAGCGAAPEDPSAAADEGASIVSSGDEGSGKFNFVPPSVEVCDGLDNDKDGQVDESDPDLGLPCNSGKLGICAAGTFVCKPFGNFVCEPNLTPQVEDCSTPEDEDCDGFGGCLGGNHIWSRAFQAPNLQGVGGVALDGAGHAFAAGMFMDTVDFGTGPFTAAAGTTDGMVVALDASTGSTLWVRHFADFGAGPDIGFGQAQSIAVKPSGNIVVAGSFGGFCDFGLGQMRSQNDTADLYVVELDASGNTVWVRTFPGIYDDRMIRVVVDSQGNSYLTGEAQGAIDFGTGVLAGWQDGFLVKLDGNGNTAWAKRFIGSGSSRTWRALVTPTDDVIIAAQLQSGDIDLGTGTITANGGDGILARYDPAGNVQSVKLFGGDFLQYISSLAMDSSGNLLIAGNYQGKTDFGAGYMYSQGDQDAFVVKLDPAYSVLWQKSLGGPGYQYASVLVDASDNVIVTGSFGGTIDLGGGGVITASDPSMPDVFVAKYDASGNLSWNRTYGDVSDQSRGDGAIDAAGNLYLPGAFRGVMDFGGASYASAGPSDMDGYVVKIGP